MERTCEQAWLMGAHIIFTQQVVGLERCAEHRSLGPLDGTQLRARPVVIATGVEWRRLGVPRLEALVGSGVYYGAALSEGRAMRDQDVVIIGAGNSAGQAALHLITGRDLPEQRRAHGAHDREPLTLETSMPGVFAAGDVRQGSIKRVASAVGDGATVVRMVHEHLRVDESPRSQGEQHAHALDT
jgi:thioredoxin reductase